MFGHKGGRKSELCDKETQAGVEIGEERVKGVLQANSFPPLSFLNFVSLRLGVLVVPILES